MGCVLDVDDNERAVHPPAFRVDLFVFGRSPLQRNPCRTTVLGKWDAQTTAYNIAGTQWLQYVHFSSHSQNEFSRSARLRLTDLSVLKCAHCFWSSVNLRSEFVRVWCWHLVVLLLLLDILRMHTKCNGPFGAMQNTCRVLGTNVSGSFACCSLVPLICLLGCAINCIRDYCVTLTMVTSLCIYDDGSRDAQCLFAWEKKTKEVKKICRGKEKQLTLCSVLCVEIGNWRVAFTAALMCYAVVVGLLQLLLLKQLSTIRVMRTRISINLNAIDCVGQYAHGHATANYQPAKCSANYTNNNNNNQSHTTNIDEWQVKPVNFRAVSVKFAFHTFCASALYWHWIPIGNEMSTMERRLPTRREEERRRGRGRRGAPEC